MLSDYTRKSVGSVIRAPDPENEFYVFVARYWPSNYEPGIGEEECVFDRWDLELAPSPSLIGEYDEETTVWSEWARQYVAEIGEDTILHRAATHAEDAGDRDVVFVCYEPDSARPRCHTFTILSVSKVNSRPRWTTSCNKLLPTKEKVKTRLVVPMRRRARTATSGVPDQTTTPYRASDVLTQRTTTNDGGVPTGIRRK
jgi:uncharacterized protein YeaO (DUF488 family)